MNQMRSSQKNRNARHKGGRPNKPSGNVLNRVYESAGPEGKVRGTPQQVIDKYLQLARDAQTSGDRVTAENFLQHAEHYVRLLNAALPPQDDRRFNGQPQYAGDDESGEDTGDSVTGEDRAQESRPQENRPAEGRQPEFRHQENRRAEPRHHEHRSEDRRRDDRRHDARHAEQRRTFDPRDEGALPLAEPDGVPQPDLAELPAEQGQPVEPVAIPVAEMPTGSGLETIDTQDADEAGPVATPEAHAEEEPKPKPRRRTRKPKATDEAPVES